MLHQLKCDPQPFDDLQAGKKTCELRFNDRDYQVDDILNLWRTFHSAAEMALGKPLAFTGAVLTVKVGHAIYGPAYGLPAGYALMSLQSLWSGVGYDPQIPLRPPAPIPMVLHCPACGTQHIDVSEGGQEVQPDGSTHFEERWTNPPHRSHLCGNCDTIWRPCDLPTTGVAAIETKGKADTWPSQKNQS